MRVIIFVILALSYESSGYVANNNLTHSVLSYHWLENTLADDDCIATTKEHEFTGVVGQTYDKAVSFCKFLGIKYATSKRYQHSLPYKSETLKLDASKDGAVCPQLNGYQVVGDEDCLYLSVYTPDVKGYLPVLVYIHGGGFAEGSITSKSYDPQFFMESKEIIVVLIQYRLGALGFVDFNSDTYPANLGLKDQVNALLWIKDNINAFGGNPNKITIQGESAGAASVSLHLFSPLSKGLFQAGISESGTACSTWAFVPKEWSRSRLRDLAENLDCDLNDIPDNIDEPADFTAKCLLSRKADEIISATQSFALPINGMNSFLPVIEKVSFKNTFLTFYPWSKPRSQVPWISGINSNEAGILIQYMSEYIWTYINNFRINIPDAFYFNYSTSHPKEISQQIEERYKFTNPVSKNDLPGLIQALSDGLFSYPNYQCHRLDTGTSYNYYFNYVLSADKEKRKQEGVFHTEELQYFFIRNGKNIRATGSDEDKKMSKTLVDLWISFVVNGKPSSDGIVWDKNTDSNQVMIIDGDGNFKMGNDPNKRNNIFWGLLPFRELTP